jgi:hypothetical protein
MAKDILHFKMIDCNDILVYRIIDVWYRNTIVLAMVTFQNTEQRQEIYPNKPLLINLKSFFSDLNCPKTLESLLNIRVSIDTFLRYRQERFVNCSFSILWKR